MSEITNTYTSSFLIDRIYSAKANETNGSLSNDHIRTKVPKMPDIKAKYINRKTYFLNFGTISDILFRDKNHVKTFFEKELTIVTSIDSNDVLIMPGRYDDINKLTEILKKYVSIYVTCGQCKNNNTSLNKVDKILMINCNKCLSKNVVKSK